MADSSKRKKVHLQKAPSFSFYLFHCSLSLSNHSDKTVSNGPDAKAIGIRWFASCTAKRLGTQNFPFSTADANEKPVWPPIRTPPVSPRWATDPPRRAGRPPPQTRLTAPAAPRRLRPPVRPPLRPGDPRRRRLQRAPGGRVLPRRRPRLPLHGVGAVGAEVRHPRVAAELGRSCPASPPPPLLPRRPRIHLPTPRRSGRSSPRARLAPPAALCRGPAAAGPLPQCLPNLRRV